MRPRKHLCDFASQEEEDSLETGYVGYMEGKVPFVLRPGERSLEWESDERRRYCSVVREACI